MGRPTNQFLTDFIAAESGETQTTVEFSCADASVLRYATDVLQIGGHAFNDDLIEADDIEQSEDNGTDRVQVKINNVLKQIGIDIKNRKLDFAAASLGKFFRRADGAFEWRENFFGEAIPISTNQQTVLIEIVDDMVAAGYCVTNWTQAPKCNLIYKGPECGSTAPFETCDHLLKGDCTRDRNTHRFVGGTLIIIKNDVAPVSPPVTIGTGGGSDGGWNNSNCFAGETGVTLGNGLKYEFRFLEANKARHIGEFARSFDSQNNRVLGRITDIYKSVADRLAHVRFSGDAEITRVKPNHRYWTENLEFVEIQQLEIGQKIWSDERFSELVTLDEYEVVEYPDGIDVFNMTIAGFAAYVANGKRVSNSKQLLQENIY